MRRSRRLTTCLCLYSLISTMKVPVPAEIWGELDFVLLDLQWEESRDRNQDERMLAPMEVQVTQAGDTGV